MAYIEYKYVTEQGNINDPGELIIDRINRESKEEGFTLSFFDFSSGLGRAILEKTIWDDEDDVSCCANGECTCQ